ncbi:uncharacterized protein LOC128667486 [Microplitis demolitor]|uniref:uncharacterized protein LOC128667486 n=1 Tax=Microplitis demolitor TaxID=69319 RepID=UPI00235B5D7F|nr:uncharacterized protein LOC128667486 [Microplitis demolitor]
MVRNYKSKNTQMSWNELAMAKAIEAVNQGEMGYLAASKAFGVPKTTLRRRSNFYKLNNDIEFVSSKGLPRKFTPVFSPVQESELVSYLKDLESRLFGLSSFEVRILAYQLAEKNQIKHPFVNGVAGEDWLQGFLKRNPTLSLRKPESTSAARAAGFNRIVIQNFFNLLKQIMEKYNLLPHRIFNVDETGCSSVPKTHGKIIAEKGKKQVGILTSAERGKNVTVELCVSASGQFLPPLFIFPRKRMKPNLLNNTIPGSWGLCHSSGWMQHDLFLQWFQWFVDQVKPTSEDPVLLILDGHTTHTNNLDVIDYARDHHVVILCLPPHCTHRLQPLDVSVMKPISSYYEQEVKKWLSEHPGRVVTPEVLPMLFSNALNKAAKPETIINGFRKTGIYPMNPDIFDSKDFAPADTTNSNKPPEEQSLENLTQSLSDLCKTDFIEGPEPEQQPEQQQLEQQELRQQEPEKPELQQQLEEPVIIPIASTSTGKPSLRPPSRYFRPQIIDESSDEEMEKSLTENITQTAASSKATMRQNTSKFYVTPYDIKPLPSRDSPPKKRRRGVTRILTSKQYRDELEEKKNNQKIKNKIAEKVTNKNKAPKIKKKKSSQKEDSDCHCLYCNGLYSESKESWIQCNNCKMWSHDSCASIEEDFSDEYTCDYCENN